MAKRTTTTVEENLEPGLESVDASDAQLVEDADMLGDALSIGVDVEGVEWTVWRLYEQGDVVPQGVRSTTGAYVCKIAGALNLERLTQLVGGGTFRVTGIGRTIDGTQRRITRTFAIDAPRKPFVREQPAAAAATAVSADGALLRQLIDEMRAQRAAPAASPLESLDALLKITERLRPEQPDPSMLVSTMLGMYRDGLRAGREVEHDEDPRDGVGAQIERVGIIVRDVLATIGSQRAARGPGAPAGGTGSQGTHRPPPASAGAAPPPPPASEAPGINPRALAFATSVQLALERDTDPTDFAESACDFMTDAELLGTANTPALLLATQLRAAISGLPDTLEPFLERFLHELRRIGSAEPDADPTETPPTETA